MLTVYLQKGINMMNAVSLSHIFIDCKDPLRLQEFYHKLTGLEKRSMYNSPGLVLNTNLMLMFSACDFEYVPLFYQRFIGLKIT